MSALSTARLVLLTALVVVGAAGPASAQICYVNSARAEAFTPIASIPGITSITPLTLSSLDDGQASVTLPFSFEFLGTSFTSVNIGSNGYLTFGADNASSLTNLVPGAAGAPDNWIAPLWDDMLHPSANNARWGVVGTAPNRIVVIEAGPATRYSATGGTLFYQVWLYEAGPAAFEYRATGSAVNTLSATVGYEGAAGAHGFSPLGCGAGCNATSGWNGQVFRTVRGNDLTVAAVTAPRGALPGSTVSIGYTVTSVGPLPSVQTQIWLSADGTIGPGDTLLASGSAAVAAGASSVSTDVVVPPIAGGSYQLLVAIDTTNAITECDELNLASAPFATAIDLSATNVVQTPPTPYETGLLTGEVTIGNIGAPFAGPVEVAIYASNDGTFDPSDVLLGTVSVTLAALPAETLPFSLTLPATLMAGSYQLVMVVDPARTLHEVSTLDDVRVGGPLEVLPSVCSDAMVTGAETCDDGNAVTEACAYGVTSCTVCSASCRAEAGATSFCGNAIVDGPEACDDGNAVTEACIYGQAFCMVCDDTCASVPGATASCGDGVTNAAETCDDGNTLTEECTYGETSCTVCNDICASVAGATSYCGDGAMAASEGCDDGNDASGDGCAADCTVEIDAGADDAAVAGDAGIGTEAGIVTDAAVNDAGARDGATSDGATSDGAARVDTGTATAPASAGCGCRVGVSRESRGWGGLALVLALWAVRRARNRRS